MRTVLRLVKAKAPVPSNDTVETLEYMLKEAKSGRLVGAAFAGMFADGEYMVGAVGAAQQQLIYTRGLVTLLWERLGEKIPNGVPPIGS